MHIGEHLPIGNTTLLVEDDEFGNGYQVGYLRYITEYKEMLLSDSQVYHFMMQTCLDVSHTDRWNAGVVSGWVAAMHGKERRIIQVEMPILMQEGKT
jgi:hypothetical protein